MSGILGVSVLMAVVLVGCVAQPTLPSADSSRSLPPSAESSVRPTEAIGTPDSTSVPSPSRATVAATWLATGRMATPHAFHTATLLRDGTVLVVGGRVNDKLDGKVSAAAELYHPTSGSWAATGGMKQARWGHTATLLPDGRVLVAGSYLIGGNPRASAELYDPSSGRWTSTGGMTAGRGGHTATLLLDGRVLVVGGGAEDDRLEGGPRSSTAELYDPASGRWSRTASMVEARNGFSATLLADGRVLVAGGDGTFAAAELYDPAGGRWTATGTMIDGRFGHTATLLGDGTVLVTGGCACSEPGALASAERYDPIRGRWTVTGSMATARMFHPATLLPNGLVLVVDDGLHDNKPPSAETYDPASGRWTVTASPARARFGYSATLLSDGTVLVAGDYDFESRATTELYVPGH